MHTGTRSQLLTRFNRKGSFEAAKLRYGEGLRWEGGAQVGGRGGVISILNNEEERSLHPDGSLSAEGFKMT